MGTEYAVPIRSFDSFNIRRKFIHLLHRFTLICCEMFLGISIFCCFHTDFRLFSQENNHTVIFALIHGFNSVYRKWQNLSPLTPFRSDEQLPENRTMCITAVAPSDAISNFCAS